MIAGISDRSTFAGFARGRRARCGPVGVRYVRPAEGAAAPAPVRVAFAVSRKAGSAPVRNRVRRRIRAVLGELDRSGIGALPAGAYLFTADGTVAELPYPELERLVGCAVARATRAD